MIKVKEDMRVRDGRYSSASMSNYIHWVLKDKLGLNDKEVRKYSKLMSVLAEVEFVWRHPMDENRAIDGLELRSDFEYETGEYLDKSSGLTAGCTFFEMLAALAIRCEDQLMRNLSEGDRTSKWFFEFLTNLELMDDRLRDDDIKDIAEGFMDGDIDMFPLKHKGIVQKNEQIWKQLSAYINENYIFEDSGMELFS